MSGNQLQTYNFDHHDVRIIFDKSGNPWWIAKEVCDVLGIRDASSAIKKLDDDEKTNVVIGTDGVRIISGRAESQTLGVWVINESGLNYIIMLSRKPVAKRFRKWVTAEVLPQIRATGSYRAIPQDYASALEYAAKLHRENEAKAKELETAQKQLIAKQLEEAAEAVTYTKRQTDIMGLKTFKSVAIEIGNGCGQNKLTKFLREKKILYWVKYQLPNGRKKEIHAPYARYESWFKSIDSVILYDNEKMVQPHLMVTPTGLLKIEALWNKAQQKQKEGKNV